MDPSSCLAWVKCFASTVLTHDGVYYFLLAIGGKLTRSATGMGKEPGLAGTSGLSTGADLGAGNLVGAGLTFSRSGISATAQCPLRGEEVVGLQQVGDIDDALPRLAEDGDVGAYRTGQVLLSDDEVGQPGRRADRRAWFVAESGVNASVDADEVGQDLVTVVDQELAVVVVALVGLGQGARQFVLHARNLAVDAQKHDCACKMPPWLRSHTGTGTDITKLGAVPNGGPVLSRWTMTRRLTSGIGVTRGEFELDIRPAGSRLAVRTSVCLLRTILRTAAWSKSGIGMSIRPARCRRRHVGRAERGGELLPGRSPPVTGLDQAPSGLGGEGAEVHRLVGCGEAPRRSCST